MNDQKIVRTNTGWGIALILAIGIQLLLVMATVTSWMPSVYTTEAAGIFLHGRTSFHRKYDLFLFRALILLSIGLTFVTVRVLKKWMFKEELRRPLQQFVILTLGWAVPGYWAGFEAIMHPATSVFKGVLAIAIAGNLLTWIWSVTNPRWCSMVDITIARALAAFKKNTWVDSIIDLGTKSALIERMVLGICIVILIVTHQEWWAQIPLPYFWPLRFACVGLYTLSFVLPIFYLVVTLIAIEKLQGQTSSYARWCRSLGAAGLALFFTYVRHPVPFIPWLSLWPLIALSVLALWKTASSGNVKWPASLWKSTTPRVWVAILGGIELGLICAWIQEQARFLVNPSDFSTIVYIAFAAGGFAVYGFLSKGSASFALLQVVLVTLASMAWFKLVVYDYRAELARFWFHWLGILILLQPLLWFALRRSVPWVKSTWEGIDPRYRAWIAWIVVPGLVFGASFVPNIEAMTAHIFMGEYMHHTDCFVMGPAWAVANGAVIDVDVYSEYGIGSVHFLVGLMKLLGGISFLNLFTIIVWICAIYFVLAYILYRLWLGNTALAMAAWMMAFKAQIGFELAYPFVFTYPQSTVARQWPDIIWMILMLIFMQSGRAWALISASLTAGFTLWYMHSIGCYMIAAHAVMTVLVAWRNPNWQRRIMACVWPTGLSLLLAVLLGVAVCGHWFFSPVFWHNVADFVKFFFISSSVPLTDSLIHKEFLNIIIFCIIVFVYILTIVKVGVDYLNPRGQTQAARKDLLALGLSIYGLGLLEHYVTFSMGNNYYTKTVPFFLVAFHWISRGLAYVPGIWQKRSSWGLAAVAFVALVTHHGYMSYPNALNVSPEPLLDKRVARPLPDGRPYFYHKHRFTIAPDLQLAVNNLGNTDEGLVTEYDFKNYQEMIARYRQDSDFSQDAQFISSLTAPQDKVVLISSYEVRILIQAKRRPFFFYFPLLETRPMRVRSLPNDLLRSQSDLERIINDLDKEKPNIIFMEKVMGRDDIPPAYNQNEPGLMAILSYVKANYVPFREGYYLIAYKRKE